MSRFDPMTTPLPELQLSTNAGEATYVHYVTDEHGRTWTPDYKLNCWKPVRVGPIDIGAPRG